LLICMALLCCASASSAQSRDFGLGLILGNPTGVSGKGFLSPKHAIDGAIGFGVLGGEHVRLHADFLWQFPIQSWPVGDLDLYAGIGAMLAAYSDHHDHGGLGLGARGPVGLALSFREAPFDIFIEVALGIWFVRKVNANIDAALGGRYWF
jgi:hypothetical protein